MLFRQLGGGGFFDPAGHRADFSSRREVRAGQFRSMRGAPLEMAVTSGAAVGEAKPLEAIFAFPQPIDPFTACRVVADGHLMSLPSPPKSGLTWNRGEGPGGKEKDKGATLRAFPSGRPRHRGAFAKRPRGRRGMTPPAMRGRAPRAGNAGDRPTARPAAGKHPPGGRRKPACRHTCGPEGSAQDACIRPAVHGTPGDPPARASKSPSRTRGCNRSGNR